jgi:hypothetical protein
LHESFDNLVSDFKKFYEKARDLKLKKIYGEMDEYDTKVMNKMHSLIL